jgi:hypothetical protein
MLSKYASSLSIDVKVRYNDKISCIGGVDPYTLTSTTLKSDVLPMIEPTDLYNYLVLGTSSYTSEQFKTYKSLEAYNQFHSGWVKEIAGCVMHGKHIVVGKVRNGDVMYRYKALLIAVHAAVAILILITTTGY